MRDEMFDRDPQRRESPLIRPRLVLGLCLIFIGVLFTLDQMGIIDDAWIVLRFWPLLLVVAGISKIAWPGSPTSRVTGGVLIAVGAWLLLEQLDYIRMSFWEYWPLLLIFFGARVVFQGLGGRSRQRRARSDDPGTINVVAFLGGAGRSSNSQNFRGGDMVAFMGGVEVNLTRAGIPPGEPALIDAFAFWGGVEITVPDDWTVRVEGFPLLGGYVDNTKPPAPDVEGPPQELVVKGFAIMGGVEVKNP